MTEYHIAVAGNIGVGKTTLTQLLADEMGWRAAFESAAENPYLIDFYRNMQVWSFHSQVFFLSQRLEQYTDIMNYSGSVVQDRTIYEDAEVFAKHLYQQKLMQERDYAVYRKVYEGIRRIIRPPDLIVFLHADVNTLKRNIDLRGHDYEKTIPFDYLVRLDTLYTSWVKNFSESSILYINKDETDFLNDPLALGQLKQQIQARLNPESRK